MPTLLSGSVAVSGRIAFQDPAELIGTNRVTVIDGTESASNHTAFPAICRCPNGDYIALICRAATHNSADQKIVLRRSTNAGLAWNAFASETTFQDTVGQADTGPTLSVIGSRIWATYVVVGYVSGSVRRVFVKYSDDNGTTWSSPVWVGDFSYPTGGLATGSRIFTAQNDGTLLMPVYAYPGLSGGSGYDALMLQSIDNGANWTLRGTIGTNSGYQYEEPQCGYLNDGRIMSLIRVDSGGAYQIYVSYSSNHGVTWTSPLSSTGFRGFGWPAWLQFSGSNHILALTRFFDPAYDFTTNDARCYGVYTVSKDLGLTWTSQRPINPSRKWFYVYADVFEKSYGVAAVMHAQADPADSHKAIIEYVEIADT